jgi:hypothetical protein
MIAVCCTGFVKNIVACGWGGGQSPPLNRFPPAAKHTRPEPTKQVKSRWQLGMYPAVRRRSAKLCMVRLLVALFVCIRYCVLVRYIDTCTLINMFGGVLLLLLFSYMFRLIVTVVRVSYNKNTIFTFMWPCIVTNFLIINQLDALISQIFWKETLHVSDSSSVHLTACKKAVSKPVWHIPFLCVRWKTPDDGQRNCPKHVKFPSKINLRN